MVVAKVECNLLSSPDYAVEHNSKFDKNKIYNCRWTVNGVVGKDAHKAYIQRISSHTRFVFNLCISATLHDFASPGLESLSTQATGCDFNQPNKDSGPWNEDIKGRVRVCGLMMSSGRKLCL